MPSQLKSRWHWKNGFVQKFVRCYKQINEKKSGSSKKDVMIVAHTFYSQDTSEPFNHEYAWWLLKCEPKWMEENCGDHKNIFYNFVGNIRLT